VLFTTFVGGSQYAAQAGESAEEQKAAVHAELSRLYKIKGQPVWQHQYYWNKAIPQFDNNIVAAHEAANTLGAHGIEAVANWRAGVGVPDCVRYARQTAEKIAGSAA
jgi:oxygen-dependent protoporphyrinogen oxidase